jgi:uncharacterized protein (TIGR02996 family)
MDTEEALLRAILDDPTDETPWLVLGDWLEEQGQDDRAELLRLSRSLRTLPPVQERQHAEQRVAQLLIAGVKPCVPTVTNSFSIALALIPAGSFLMGSPGKELGRFADEGPRHKVTLTRPFFLGVFQVTQAQWRAVMGTNPSHFPGDHHPVERVSWDEAREFCRSLSEREKRSYRLPTEAEWEYACRAGTTTPFYFGGTLSDQLANYDANVTYANSLRGTYRRRTVPVGGFPPNAWGLYDMHGNVREWCEDRFGSYGRGAVTDPQGVQTGTDRVARGGAWYNVPGYCRCAFRRSHSPDSQDSEVGFRVCREYE